MGDHNENGKKKNNSSYLPIGLCIGLAIGTAIGTATHNIGLWMPVGVAVGLGLALVLGHKNTDENEDDANDKQ